MSLIGYRYVLTGSFFILEIRAMNNLVQQIQYLSSLQFRIHYYYNKIDSKPVSQMVQTAWACSRLLFLRIHGHSLLCGLWFCSVDQARPSHNHIVLSGIYSVCGSLNQSLFDQVVPAIVTIMGGKPSWVAKTEYNWSSCSGKGSSALEPTLPTFDEEAGATLNTNTQVKAGTQAHRTYPYAC